MATDYSGMTLNERLYIAKLMDEFNSAIKRNDKENVIEILKKVDLDSTEAAFIINTIYNNPKKYGY